VTTPTHGSSRLPALPGPSGEDSARLAAVPLFQDRPVTVTALPGGLTNRNYRVDAGPRSYVARLSSPSTALLAIDRDAEHAHALAAAAAGVGPEVAAYLPQAGVLVVGWVPGRTLTEADLQDPGMLLRVAAVCRQLHAATGFTARFDMFRLQRQYLRTVQEQGFRLPPRYLEFLPAVERIEAALAVRPEPLVPCHNDLLAANIIDDGQRLWLIDYEYSGLNDPCFELGNLWSEAGGPPDLLEVLVAAYAGRSSPRRVARSRLLGLMSAYGWTLWASIQDAVSPLGADYWSWGMEKFHRAVAEFDGPALPRLLEEVGLDD
jgi:thiamine kinase-like enzyme